MVGGFLVELAIEIVPQGGFESVDFGAEGAGADRCCAVRSCGLVGAGLFDVVADTVGIDEK